MIFLTFFQDKLPFLTMPRHILLVPRFVLDELGCECSHKECIHNIIELCFFKKIPHMTLDEKENFYEGFKDSCCPCECDGRYERFRIEKDALNGFLKKQDHCKIVMIRNN